jgi:hypothetical protein
LGTIKANRKLDGVRVDQRERALRHRRYKRVAVTATDGDKRTYLVRELRGKLYRVPQTRGNERSYLVFYCYFLICEKAAIRVDV